MQIGQVLPILIQRRKNISESSLFSLADFEYIKQRAIASRQKYNRDIASDFSCSINLTNFASGFNNLVVELAFSDNVYWVIRIPHHTFDDEDRTSLLSEIATMNIIRERTSIPVPRIVDFDMSTDQPFGHPFVFMESLGGHSLDHILAFSIPRHHHSKVARQFANIFVELQNLTFDRIGRFWCGEKADQPVEIIAMAWHASPGSLEISLECFYNQRQAENRETVAMHPNDPDWLTACWGRKTALAHIIVENRV